MHCRILDIAVLCFGLSMNILFPVLGFGFCLNFFFSRERWSPIFTIAFYFPTSYYATVS
jgi:hypothetical protein